jgi:putative transposase
MGLAICNRRFCIYLLRSDIATPGWSSDFHYFYTMEKKEHYRHRLPHFQQPGQAYFVTWCLKDAIPVKAVIRYTQKLKELKAQIKILEEHNVNNESKVELQYLYQHERKKYLKAYNDLLDTEKKPLVNLAKSENTEVIIQSLKYWEGKRLINYAYTIMPNHVHWVFELNKSDEDDKPVYLQDVLQSVKRYSAKMINKLENRQGGLWQKESFDTTIRDDRHMVNAIAYTLNNPVAAGLVKDWKVWPGTWCAGEYGNSF